MRSLTLAAALAAMLAAPAWADLVTLKDGSKREGKVVRQDDEEVVLEITQGRLKAEVTFKRSEVKGIEKGPTAAEKTLAEVEKRRAALKDDDAAGWLGFAQWLDRLTGFSQDARAAYEKVVRLDPENEAARRKLGYQKIGGQWLTEAEIMTAKGLVLHNGKWVTPEEKKKAEESLARQLDDIRIALADETRKPDGELPAGPDARRLELWRRAMEEIAKQRAAQYGPDYVGSTSGGPTMGPYGYGYYGVYTSTGEYLPFVPSGGIYYYTAGSRWPGSAGTWGGSWGSYYGFNFHYKDKHIDLHWGR
jgi:hypothetical protein